MNFFPVNLLANLYLDRQSATLVFDLIQIFSCNVRNTLFSIVGIIRDSEGASLVMLFLRWQMLWLVAFDAPKI